MKVWRFRNGVSSEDLRLLGHLLIMLFFILLPSLTGSQDSVAATGSPARRPGDLDIPDSSSHDVARLNSTSLHPSLSAGHPNLYQLSPTASASDSEPSNPIPSYPAQAQKSESSELEDGAHSSSTWRRRRSVTDTAASANKIHNLKQDIAPNHDSRHPIKTASRPQTQVVSADEHHHNQDASTHRHQKHRHRHQKHRHQKHRQQQLQQRQHEFSRSANVFQITRAPARARTVLDVLSSDSRFSRLTKAIKQYSDIVEKLSSTSAAVTVFAPVNGAWDKIEVPPTKEELKRVILYHVLNVKVGSDRLEDGQVIPTLLSEPDLDDQLQELKVTTDEGLTKINGATIIDPDLHDADNGIVHAIDQVLFPPENAARVISTDARLSDLTNAIRYANLVDTIASTHSITILAPSNQAFERLSPALRRFLLTPVGRPVLERILKYHVIPQLVYTPTVPQEATTYPTVLGLPIRLQRVNEKNVVINDYAHIAVSDDFAKNGVVHVIDEVLIPIHQIVTWVQEHLTGAKRTQQHRHDQHPSSISKD